MPHTMWAEGRTVNELENVKLAQIPEDLYAVLRSFNNFEC